MLKMNWAENKHSMESKSNIQYMYNLNGSNTDGSFTVDVPTKFSQ